MKPSPARVSGRVSVGRGPLHVHEAHPVSIPSSAQLPGAIDLALELRALVDGIDVGFIGLVRSLPPTKVRHTVATDDARWELGDDSGRRFHEAGAGRTHRWSGRRLPTLFGRPMVTACESSLRPRYPDDRVKGQGQGPLPGDSADPTGALAQLSRAGGAPRGPARKGAAGRLRQLDMWRTHEAEWHHVILRAEGLRRLTPWDVTVQAERCGDALVLAEHATGIGLARPCPGAGSGRRVRHVCPARRTVVGM